jgi:hypothetical protein
LASDPTSFAGVIVGGSHQVLLSEGERTGFVRLRVTCARDAYRAAMAAVYTACHAVLRPGGLLVTVTKNMRRHGRLVDLAAITRRLAIDAGFSYLQHVVALHTAIRDSRLVPRPSFWQLSQVRRARAAGHPIHLVAHEDALVFTKASRCG